MGYFGPFLSIGGFRGRTPPATKEPGAMGKQIVMFTPGSMRSMLFQGTNQTIDDQGRVSGVPWRFR